MLDELDKEKKKSDQVKNDLLEQFTLELSFADNKCLNGKAYLIDRYYNRCDWLFWILWLQVFSNVNCSKGTIMFK